MRALLGILIIVLIGVVVLGFYQGWFQVATHDSGQKSNFEISVDKQRIKEDEEKAKEKAQELQEKAKQKIHDASK
jgi:hypothetical protein